MGWRMEAPAADGSLVEAAVEAVRGGSHRALPGGCTASTCAAGTCTVAALVCSVGRGGTKRAHAAVVGLPASLGFAAWGGGTTEEEAAAAATEGGME
jgi:hypothetical protein